MQSISANLNIMIKAAEKASRALIRDFGEIEKLQVSIKGPTDFVSNAQEYVPKMMYKVEEHEDSPKKHCCRSRCSWDITTVYLQLDSRRILDIRMICAGYVF